MPPRRIVRILRNLGDPERHDVGSTCDLRRRLSEHARGGVGATTRTRPWQLLAAFWFRDGATAIAFERYLKSGSGRSFARRHFGGPV